MSYRSVQERLMRATHYIEGSNLAYIENPKVACSNIKWSLLSNYSPNFLNNVSNIHDRRQTPFERDFQGIISTCRNPSIHKFSIVRHPRDRFISAYFDKMYEGRDESVWRLISGAIGLDENEVYEPKVILERLSRVSAQDLDPHVARQTTNLFWGSIQFSNVIHLEALSRRNKFIEISGYRIDLVDHQRHSTKDRVNLNIFDSEALEMVDYLYADDYAAFGYSAGNSLPAQDMLDPEFRSFLLDFLASKTPIRFLIEFFESGPRKLRYLEVGGVIDLLSSRGIWGKVPHQIIDFLIARNAILQEDNALRFSSKFTEFPVK